MTPSAGDFAGPGTRVILIGSGRHNPGSRYPDLPSVATTIEDLAATLAGRCGVDDSHITVVTDPEDPIRLADAIEASAGEAGDVFLLWYVGHGVLDADGALHLATRATVDLSRGRVAHQALPYTDVHAVIRERCRARTVVVVVDACHAGRASPVSARSLWAALDRVGRGTCLLASASRDEHALAPDGARCTTFTGAVLSLLDEGDPHWGSPHLTLDRVARYLARTLPGRGFPAPRWWTADQAGDLVVTDNRAFRVPSAPGPVPRGGPDGPDVAGEGEPVCPYPGLKAFEPDDARFFHGRQDLTEDLTKMVERRLGGGGPLFVLGPSGSGKSSLVRAGLLPALAHGAVAGGASAAWPQLLLTPGDDPLGALAERIAGPVGEDADVVRARLRADPRSFTDLARVALGAEPGRLAGPAGAGGEDNKDNRDDNGEDDDDEDTDGPGDASRMKDASTDTGMDAGGSTATEHGGMAGTGGGGRNGPDDAPQANDTDPGTGMGAAGDTPGSTAAEFGCLRLMVVVDQFEELFTLCEDDGDRVAFIRAIDALSSGRDGESPAAVVVPVMRADFFENCAAYPELASASRDGQLVVGPMSRGEVREAVELPAYSVGLALEPGLVELLLSDLGAADGRGHEPGALPLLGHALFETWQRREGRILTVGGYRDTGGIEGAIGKTAEATYDELDERGRETARRMLVRLVNVRDYTRRRVERAALLAGAPDSAVVARVLNRLADARLLTVGEDTIEITHEALLRGWLRLREWVDTDRDLEELVQEIEPDARRWEEARQKEEATNKRRRRWRKQKRPSRDLLYRGGRLAAVLDRLAALSGHDRKFVGG